MKKKIQIQVVYETEIDSSDSHWKPYDTPGKLAGHFDAAIDDGLISLEEFKLLTIDFNIDGKHVYRDEFKYLDGDSLDDDEELVPEDEDDE